MVEKELGKINKYGWERVRQNIKYGPKVVRKSEMKHWQKGLQPLSYMDKKGLGKY